MSATTIDPVRRTNISEREHILTETERLIEALSKEEKEKVIDFVSVLKVGHTQEPLPHHPSEE